MVEMNEDAPVDSLPCGFDGYTFREYDGVTPPFPVYKTKYDFPGEVIYNPPFGFTNGTDDASRSNGDNVRRTYLGFSNNIGFDPDFFQYKGKRAPLDLCNVDGVEWSYQTRGFHMDKDASVIVNLRQVEHLNIMLVMLHSNKNLQVKQVHTTEFTQENSQQCSMVVLTDGISIENIEQTETDMFLVE
jgi:hypothetical protein